MFTSGPIVFTTKCSKTIKRNPYYSGLPNNEGFQDRMDELEIAVGLTQIF